MTPQKGTKRPWRIVVKWTHWTRRNEVAIYASYTTLASARKAAANVASHNWCEFVRIEYRDNPGVPIGDGAS